ncbi:thiamine pyrophosphate-binding protein [Streptomyces sp. TP-A0874]|uniref:thiamine pyrophosphate-binding protein n=1 Tax=Streptomyces sp. TP-A0874 TaxID=549819 RepID=UPI00085388D5|nr:thiamine pyrophosphate-binding protein [Streptomyces sp. TP-A0874]
MTSIDAPNRDGTRSDADMTVAHLLARRLAEAGVEVVFGVPGEDCQGLLEAIDARPDLTFVATRHEGAAAMMAEAHGKLTGSMGCCLATSSVGAVNLLSGVNVADHDSTPLVVLVGQVDAATRGRGGWQECDILGLFRPFCRNVTELDNPARADHDLWRAVNAARAARPGPVLVAVPRDCQDLPAPRTAPTLRSLIRPGPAAVDIAAATRLLGDAERPVLIAGGGVRAAGATAELTAFAERLGAPVLTAFRRTDAVDNRHPAYVGALSHNPGPIVLECLAEADVFAVIGSRMTGITAQRYQFPRDDQRVVHIDIDGAGLATSWLGAEVAIHSDARCALEELTRALPVRGAPPAPWWTSWTADRSGHRQRSAATREQQIIVRVAEVLDTLLPSDAVLSCDAGDFSIAAGPAIAVGGGRRYLGSTSGSMGYGIPAAIAAKRVWPDRVCVALCGDGGAMMTIQELETAKRLDAGIVVVVFNNNGYGSIRRHQDRRPGGRRVGTELTNPDFAALARLFGFRGHLIVRPDDIPRVWQAVRDEPMAGHVIEVDIPTAPVPHQRTAPGEE